MHLDHALRAAIISALEFQRDNTLSQSEMDKAILNLVLFKDAIANSWKGAFENYRLEPGDIIPISDVMTNQIEDGPKTASEVMAEHRAREVQTRKWRDIVDWFAKLDAQNNKERKQLYRLWR